jgi:hypothetical protein
MSLSSKSVLAGAALLACALVSPTFAAERSAVSLSGPRADFSVVQARRAALLSSRTASPAATASTAKDLISNSYRAYPASCFSDTLPSPSNAIQPLPITPTGPVYSRTVTLGTNSQNTSEDVTITIWRVACSSSGDKLSYNPDGGYVGATLMRIQRQSAYEGDSQLYPVYPDIRIAQGNITFDNPNFTDYVRVASEPNTVVSDTIVGSPIINSTTYVLENYPNPSLGFFYFNNAFTIRFDNGYQGGRVTTSVPDYSPTSQTYPAAFLPMAVNGYLTGSWYDPTHGGEGMLTQVYDTGDGVNRTFFAAWYTFDQSGLPFWLVAQANFPIGTTQLQNVQVLYATGGGFAGHFTPPIQRNVWGTMNVSFPDCQHIKFDYNGSTGTVQGGPGGSGTGVVWTRLGNINSLNCQ